MSVQLTDECGGAEDPDRPRAGPNGTERPDQERPDPTDPVKVEDAKAAADDMREVEDRQAKEHTLEQQHNENNNSEDGGSGSGSGSGGNGGSTPTEPNPPSDLNDGGTSSSNGGRSGQSPPTYNQPSSYVRSANGKHIWVYDEEGKLQWDIDANRAKPYVWNQNPRTGQSYPKEGDKVPTPDSWFDLLMR